MLFRKPPFSLTELFNPQSDIDSVPVVMYYFGVIKTLGTAVFCILTDWLDFSTLNMAACYSPAVIVKENLP